MVTDAARSVSKLPYVRSHAPKTSQRESLTEPVSCIRSRA